jgi:hypothetical protein
MRNALLLGIGFSIGLMGCGSDDSASSPGDVGADGGIGSGGDGSVVGDGGAIADAGPPEPTSPPVISGTVTITGNVYCSQHTTGKKGTSVYFTALDGPPAINSEFASIVAAHYPASGLNGDAARVLQTEFATRLTYDVDGPVQAMLYSDVEFTGRTLYDLTGTISVKNGATWFTVASYTPNKSFKYPAPMLKPDVALVTPSKAPIVLNVGSVAIKFLYVPAGKFLMGEPYYTCPSWQEDPPHLVTLTKGYYLAETPITWEQYKAATGTDLRAGGENAQAAANLSCANTYAFAKALATMTGKTVRPPTAAELVYAFRAGTSNPPFAAKYSGQGIVASMTAAVKASPPNAWGFYQWMTDIGWERAGDLPVSEHMDVTDPSYTPPQDPNNASATHDHAGYGRSEYPIGELEFIDQAAGVVNTYPNLIRQRVLIEE